MPLFKVPITADVYDVALLKCWMDDDIMFSISKPGERTIENYEEVISVYKELSKNGTQKLCIIGDITKTEPSAKAVRDFLNAELPKYIKAMALISNSPMGREIGVLFQTLSSSPYPVRVYNNLEDATRWLKEEMAGERAHN